MTAVTSDAGDRDQSRTRVATEMKEITAIPKAETFNNDGDYMRLFVNLGTKDGFYKASFLQFILDMSDLRKEVLGRIDMKEMNSWVEMEKGSCQPNDSRAGR